MQFNRQAQVVVGGRAWEGVRIRMLVEAGDGSAPNRVQAELFNLNDDDIAYIQEGERIAHLFAGYETLSVIGAGYISRIETEWQGVDRITILECADGQRQYNSHVKISESGPVSAINIIEKVASKMGYKDVDLSGVKTLIGNIPAPGGFSFSGFGKEALDGLAKSTGTQWHVKNQRLIMLPKGEPTQEKAVLIRADSGLVGAPQNTEKGIKFKCLLNPGITARRTVKVESKEITGFYYIQNYRHVADTHGADWYTECEAIRHV